MSQKHETASKRSDFEKDLVQLRGLLPAVNADYPAPIAIPFVRFACEVSGLSPSWEQGFKRYLDAFEFSVRFLALVAAQEFLQRAAQADELKAAKGARQGVLLLRDNPKLSTGAWWSLLRETLRALRSLKEPSESAAGELAKRYFKGRGGSVAEVAAVLDTIPNLRNATAHSSARETQETIELLQENLPKLHKWYAALDFLGNHRLAFVRNCVKEESTWRCELEILNGDRRFFDRCIVQSVAGLDSGHVVMIKRAPGDGDRPLEADDVLDLHPFVHADVKPGEGAAEILVFEACHGAELEYSSTLTGKKVRLGGPVVESFSMLVGRLARTEGSNFSGKLLEVLNEPAKRARSATEALLERARNERLYDPELHVDRREMRRQIGDFLASDKSVMILGGPSGIGKSSFLCRYADEWLQSKDDSVLCLLTAHDAFPHDNPSIEGVVAQRLLDPGKTLDGLLRDAAKAAEGAGDRAWKLLVIVDGIDKHPDLGKMLAAVNAWATKFGGPERKDAPLRSNLKLVVSCSPTGLDRAQKDVKFNVASYYVPATAILASESAESPALPAVQLGEFDPDELRVAFDKYAQRKGSQPRTRFKQLSDTARRALSHPLFLRIVMETYDGQHVPERPISFQTLEHFCMTTILADPATREFADGLVDAMLAKRKRQLPVSHLRNDERLRDAYLANNSPYKALVDNQVLVTNARERVTFPIPVREEYVEFAMDRVLQYLLVLRALEKHAETPKKFIDHGLKNILDTAHEFPSLRAGVVELMAEIARSAAIKPKGPDAGAPGGAEARGSDADAEAERDADERSRRLRKCVQVVVDDGADAKDNSWTRDFLSEVVLNLAGDLQGAGEEEAAEEEQPPKSEALKIVMTTLLEEDAPLALRVMFQTVDKLFRMGWWHGAIALLGVAEESGKLRDEDRFKVRNRLVVLLKNQDYWSLARAASDKNHAGVPAGADASGEPRTSDHLRHFLNRFSVLYDQGERKEAVRLCNAANSAARRLRLPLEEAATANNLAIAKVYLDRPAEALALLEEAIKVAREIDAPDRRGIVNGHLHLDRALIRLFAWQLDHRGLKAAGENLEAPLRALEPIARDLDEASRLFKGAEHAQGILYARGAEGLVGMCRARCLADPKETLDEAAAVMADGLEMAIRMKEDWATYGIRTNLALLHRQAGGEAGLQAAREEARKAHLLAHGNDDPEGTWISGMVVCRLMLDDAAALPERAAERAAALERVGRKLDRAIEEMEKLEFHYAAALACAGLVEKAGLAGEDPAQWVERREKFRKKLDPARYPPAVTETFEPLDWKHFFLAELF